jgi:DNA-binding transcriptional MerR regulator
VGEDGRWRIEELAERSGISVYTLRYYQRQRLLPSGEQNGKAKWYGAEHLARLQQIRALQDEGFSLAAIRVVLDESAPPGAWGLFRQHETEHLTARELRDRSGVSGDFVRALADAGALGDPRVSTTTRRRFDSADERLLDVVRSLSELGLPDDIVVSIVTGTLEHLDALGRHNQELLFGDAGTWSAEDRDRFRAQLPEHMDRLRDAVAWMVRLLQLRSAQRLLVSSGSTTDPGRRRSRGPRP